MKIPAAYLGELREIGDEFYVTSEDGNSAKVYPMKVWVEKEKKLEKISGHNAAKRKFLTRTNYYGAVVKMDKQGRLLIPPVLREAAQIAGDVDVLGYQNYLEVWNHMRFQDHLRKSEITEDDSKALADLDI